MLYPNLPRPDRDADTLDYTTTLCCRRASQPGTIATSELAPPTSNQSSSPHPLGYAAFGLVSGARSHVAFLCVRDVRCQAQWARLQPLHTRSRLRYISLAPRGHVSTCAICIDALCVRPIDSSLFGKPSVCLVVLGSVRKVSTFVRALAFI